MCFAFFSLDSIYGHLLYRKRWIFFNLVSVCIACLACMLGCSTLWHIYYMLHRRRRHRLRSLFFSFFSLSLSLSRLSFPSPFTFSFYLYVCVCVGGWRRVRVFFILPTLRTYLPFTVSIPSFTRTSTSTIRKNERPRMFFTNRYPLPLPLAFTRRHTPKREKGRGGFGGWLRWRVCRVGER